MEAYFDIRFSFNYLFTLSTFLLLGTVEHAILDEFTLEIEPVTSLMVKKRKEKGK